MPSCLHLDLRDRSDTKRRPPGGVNGIRHADREQVLDPQGHRPRAAPASGGHEQARIGGVFSGVEDAWPRIEVRPHPIILGRMNHHAVIALDIRMAGSGPAMSLGPIFGPVRWHLETSKIDRWELEHLVTSMKMNADDRFRHPA